MHYPVVLVHEPDHRWASLLRVQAADRAWVLREVRSVEDCRAVVRMSSAVVAIVRLESKRKDGWEMLAWLNETHPAVLVIAILDDLRADAAGMAWDLGAHDLVAADRAGTELAGVVHRLIHQQWAGMP